MVDGRGPSAHAWYGVLDVLRQSMGCIREAFEPGFADKNASNTADPDAQATSIARRLPRLPRRL